MIPFIRSAEIGKEETEISLTKQGLENSAAKLVDRGDVLVALYGANSGDVALAKVSGAINQAILCIRPEGSKAFLYHFLTERKSWILATYLQGGQGNLSGDIVKSVALRFPSPDEQEAVADCLTSLDDCVAAQGRKVEALKTHKRGLMQELFPRKGETLPRLRFPEFRDAGEWFQKPIGEMVHDRSRPIEMDDNQQYSLITVKRRYGGVVSRERLKGRAIKVKSQFIVKRGDFLISKRQIVHDAFGIVPHELDGSIVSNEYTVLGPNAGCDMEFFNYFCQQPAVSSSFLHSSVGIVIEKMLFKLDTWLKLEFLFPSVEEQQRIARCLRAVEDRIAAESERLDALKTHKKGLTQQLFPSTKSVEA
jgi:type I restriction enzyme, S subunit